MKVSELRLRFPCFAILLFECWLMILLDSAGSTGFGTRIGIGVGVALLVLVVVLIGGYIMSESLASVSVRALESH